MTGRGGGRPRRGIRRPRGPAPPGGRGGSAGLGTLEVAVALGILAVFATALFAGMGAAGAGLFDQLTRQAAVGCAARVMEQVRAGLAAGGAPPVEGECGSPLGRDLRYQVEVRPDPDPVAVRDGSRPATEGDGDGAGDAVLVTVQVRREAGTGEAAPIYTVASVFWLPGPLAPPGRAGTPP